MTRQRKSRHRNRHPFRYRFSAFVESLEPRWMMTHDGLDDVPALVDGPSITSEPGAFIALPGTGQMANPVYGSTFRSALNGGVGYWDNPASWAAGRVPTATDKVIIQAGDTVVIRNTAAIAESIGVYAGAKLQFANDVNTELKVITIVVLGTLQMGTAANPVADSVSAKLTIRDVPINTTLDPAQYGNGLIGLGKITMHGAAKLSEVRLAAEPLVGDTVLTLAEPATGWKVGDRLVLPDTRHLSAGGGEIWSNYVPQWEQLTIAAISPDGRSITLSAPLAFDHIGARNNLGALEFLPHLANRSRSVVVRSENANGTRGYAIFNYRADVDIRYATFAGLGRTTKAATDDTTFDTNGAVTHVGTNQSGRYPVYFDHLYGPVGGQPNGYQYTFVGNAVFCPIDPMPFRWGITLEDSHYGLIKDNVLYNWAGAGLAAIGGNESYNVIEGNLVIATRGDSNPRINDGLDGSGFWFKGWNNYIRDNVAANSVGTNQGIVAGSGFNLFWTPASTASTRIPTGPGADVLGGQYQLINMQLTPLREFARNEAYGATATGLTLWHLGTDGYSSSSVAESIVRDFTAWHIYEEGFFGYPIQNVTFDGFVVRGHSRALHPFSAGSGWTSGDYWAGNVTIRRADIQGMWSGIGGSTNTPGTFTIENSYLSNYNSNISIQTLATPGSRASKPPRQTVIRNVRFDPMADGPYPSYPAEFRTINMNYYDQHGGTDFIQQDRVLVYDYNGVAGQNYQVYYNEQNPDFVVPQTTYYGPDNNADGIGDWVDSQGSPVAGLTNQENWDLYHIAIAGEVLPADASSLPEIHGLVRSFVVAPDSTPPAAPTGLTATAVSPSQINLSWTAATDNVGVTGYRIFRNGTPVGTATGTSFASTGLTGGTTYTYTVAAFDAAGNSSSVSAAASATTTSLADTSPPSTPTALTATAVSSSQINLSWTAATDNVGVAGYRIFRDGTPIATTTATSFASTGLAAATTYTYTVAAFDTAGNSSSASAAASAMTTALTDTTPPTISGAAVTNLTTSGATIAWTTNEAADTQVEYGTTSSYGSSTPLDTALVTGHAVNLAGLTAGTVYHFRIKARDAAGNLQVSQDFTFTSGALFKQIIDDGSPGHAFAGSWKRITGRGYENDIQTASKGAGGTTSTWTFSNLASGEYRVWATWRISSAYATNAPFTIYDGGVAKSTVLVNEKVTPNDLSADGALWESLGTVSIASGRLVVKLTNKANGQVVADAIRIERVSSPTAPTTAPEIGVSVGGYGMTSAQSVITYGPVNLGAPQTYVYTVTNQGDGALSLTPISSVPSGFSLTQNLSATTLAPGASTTFAIALDASSPGTFGGTVAIVNNDSNENPFTFQVAGSVVDPNAPYTKIIDDGSAGHQFVGTWTRDATRGYGGDLYTAKSGAGAITSTWTFSAIPDGQYQVYATWRIGTNNASDAPFTLYNGAQAVSTVRKDQRATPNDYWDGTTNWESLGTVTISGGQLVVRLTNAASNQVVADAIRIA